MRSADRGCWDEVFGGFIVNAIYSYQTGYPLYFSADIPLQAGVSLRDISARPAADDRNAERAEYVGDFATASSQQFVFICARCRRRWPGFGRMASTTWTLRC